MVRRKWRTPIEHDRRQRSDTQCWKRGGGGYQQMQTSGLWFNRETGRVMSREAVAAHDSEWLAHWITGQ